MRRWFGNNGGQKGYQGDEPLSADEVKLFLETVSISAVNKRHSRLSLKGSKWYHVWLKK